MLKTLSLLPPRSFFETSSGADDRDAAWNSLATDVPNTLNPEYVMLSGRIYKKPAFAANDDMSARDKAIYQQKQAAIEAFSRNDNSTTQISYDQLVGLQQQTAIKNFMDGKNAAEAIKPKDRENKVILLQQLGEITALAQDMYDNGINLVDQGLSDKTQEFYKTLSQLKAPNTANMSLMPLAADRTYTNSRVALVLDQMLKDSSNIVSADELKQYLDNNPDLLKLIKSANVRPVAPAKPITPVDPAAVAEESDPAAAEEIDPAVLAIEEEDNKFLTDTQIAISGNQKAINFLKKSYLVPTENPEQGDLIERVDPNGDVSYGILSKNKTSGSWQMGFRDRTNGSFTYKALGNIDNKNIYHIEQPGKAGPAVEDIRFMDVLKNDQLYTIKSSRNFIPLENRLDFVRKDLMNLYNTHHT